MTTDVTFAEALEKRAFKIAFVLRRKGQLHDRGTFLVRGTSDMSTHRPTIWEEIV